jgi:leucyl-tRNA synthetase
VKPWSTKGVEGVYRFLGRVWRIFISEESITHMEQNLTLDITQADSLLEGLNLSPNIQDVEPSPDQLKTIHRTIKKVTEDLDGLRFNTAISALMVFVNEAITWEVKPASILLDFLKLLQPFAPHISEELADKLLKLMKDAPSSGTIAYLKWPQFEQKHLVESYLEYPIQVNGKLRDKITVSADVSMQEIQDLALTAEKVLPFLEGKTIKKVIVIPNKIVNIAVL